MTVLGWIFFGLIIGLIGKLAMPEKSLQEFIFTAFLGIAGALIGGFLEPARLVSRRRADGIRSGSGRSIVLLAFYRMMIVDH